ncbi:MAG TPA: choice-of-anchor D domain-containing protein [Pyrinomonadaceae bacterium]|jgi:chitodextrinase
MYRSKQAQSKKRSNSTSTFGKSYSLARRASYVALVALLAVSYSYLPSQTKAQGPVVNNPPVAPHSILVFTERAFVSVSGYDPTHTVRVEVHHQPSALGPGTIIQSQTGNPGADGIFEVNHPGGVCWLTNTPDMRAGDRVQTIDTDPATGVVTIDETTVQGLKAASPVTVTADDPATPAGEGVVTITGTAFDPAGNPLDINSLEQRMVIPGDAFDLNGRRTLRADAAAANDGVLVYTTPGNWTATYRGLSQADVDRVMGGDTRIMWLGADPAAGVEGTIYEVGQVKAPMGGCPAPLERLPPPPGSELVPPTTPTNLTYTITGTNTVHLAWTASTDNVGVTGYEIYRDAILIGVVDATAPGFTTTYTDINAPAGTHQYTIDAFDAVNNFSALSAPLTVITTLNPDTFAGVVNEPPANGLIMIAFPGRDFVSNEGYLSTDTVEIQLIRNSAVISNATGLVPNADTIVEVNHPGGGCWIGNTPEMRAGDKVRSIARNPDGTIRSVDQITVSNVLPQRPTTFAADGVTPLPAGTVEIRGTAVGLDGNPIPIDQLEQRMIGSSADRFAVNDRRDIRADSTGTAVGFLRYDTVNNPTGTKWTATYSNLTAADVQRVLAAESRIMWLGRDPLAGIELTISEIGPQTANGPGAPCAAPGEAADTLAPSIPQNAVTTSNGVAVDVSWDAATDDTYVFGYTVYRDGQPIHYVGYNVANPTLTVPTSASSPLLTYHDANPGAGSHTYTVDAFDSAGNHSAQSAPATNAVPDLTAPTVPSNLVATSSGDTVTLSWTASFDDVGVADYVVTRTGGAGPATFTLTCGPTFNCNASTLSVTQTGLAAATYTYTVNAGDAAGNRSAQSAPISVVVAGAADVTPPTAPTNLVADTRDVYSGATAPSPALGSHDVKLTWAASTDNVAVTGYGVYRRRVTQLDPARIVDAYTKIADLNAATLTFTDVNVAVGTYDYTVKAVDSAGNNSADADFRTAASVNDPPRAGNPLASPPVGAHQIISFPQRDFVSGSGYVDRINPADPLSVARVTVTVIRNGKVWATSESVFPADDAATPDFDGIVEVNHPGGGCWLGFTPDIRPGDIIRYTDGLGMTDQTTTSNVFAERATDLASDGTPLPAGEVRIHGTAQDAAGNPIPVAQLEQRVIARGVGVFNFNGKTQARAASAAVDGVLSYDPVDPVTNPKGINWTAKYTGLSSADVDLMLSSESRAVWLGRDALAGNELTIFENGDGVAGGPQGTCTAPAEAGPAAALNPASVTFASQTVNTTSASQTVTLTNTGTADATRAITGAMSVATASLSVASDFQITSNTCNAATLQIGQSCSVSLTFKPSALGTRKANLVFKDNANNSPVQIVPLSGTGSDAGPTVTNLVHSFEIPSVVSITRNAQGTITDTLARVELTWTGTQGGAAIARYEVEQSINTGTGWGAPVVSNTPRFAITLSMGTFATPKNYRFRVRAFDVNGRASAYATDSQFGLSVADDGLSGTVTYQGSWSTQTLPGSFGAFGVVHFATAAGPRANLNKLTYVNASFVALVSATGPDRGLASVSIDGGAATTVDMYSSTLKLAQVMVESNLPSGQHTVTVNSLGQRSPVCLAGPNPASCGTRVDIDSFLLLR